jgi:large subunit ribosomal protein L6
MSRIGKSPVLIVPGVTVTVHADTLEVKGPKGMLSMRIPSDVQVAMEGQTITVSLSNDASKNHAIHGLVRAEIDNMIIGVSKGWSKVLMLSGVGYRATLNGTDLVLTVGFSHPVIVKPPEGITFAMQDGKIVVSGINKQVVGQVASDIRKVKPPEPYKGKGIMYEGEHIRKKAGKSAKGVGAGAK